MKQFIYFLFAFFIVSCSNKEAKKSFDSISVETKAEEYTSSSSTKYLTIASQKLQQYGDLLKLQKKHPSLKNDIITQLQSLSETNIISIDTTYKIENIQQIGNIKRVSDSVKKIKLTYTLFSKTEQIEDSVTVFIKTTTINLDGKIGTANKITFYKK